MADELTLLYLEPDEEITSVVRRVREADAGRVVLVAPGRAKATSSTTALRLLARVAIGEGRDVAIVGDALTRSLAAEADLTAFSTVDDARAARAAAPVTPQRAAIHVLRGDEQTGEHALTPPPATAPVPTGRGDETSVVPLARPHRPAPGAAPRRAARRPMAIAGIAIVALAFLVVVGGAAAILPGATVAIQPATQVVGPLTYDLVFDTPTITSGTVDETVDAPVAGTYEELVPAAGGVTFFNWGFGAVNVPAGTPVGAGEVVLATDGAVVVPGAVLISFNPPTVQAGEASVAVTAVEPGPAGNVAAGAINAVLDDEVAAQLRGLPDNQERLVANAEATAGGLANSGPEVVQADVDAALAALRERLAARVAQALEAAVGINVDQPVEAQIEIPEDLLGRRDEETFTLAGSLAYERATVDPVDVAAAARLELEGDETAVTSGHELIADSVAHTPGEPRREGGSVIVPVTVTARSQQSIDTDAIRRDITGRPVGDVEALLSPLGDVSITTWPGWVEAIPALEWRIEITVGAAEFSEPIPSASVGASP